MFRAEMEVRDSKDPMAVFTALRPESGEGRRFTSKVERRNSSVLITIEAEDPVALRAAVNSYLRLLRLLHDTEEEL